MARSHLAALLVFSVAACGPAGSDESEYTASGPGAALGGAVTVGPVPETASDPSASTKVAPTISPGVESRAAPEFVWSVTPVDDGNRHDLASTWRDGCPVHFTDLTLVELIHWNYQGETTTGRLVIGRQHVDAIVTVFERLFDAGFPIERMELIERYGGDDQASMVANNTSAFNCREIAGSPGVWSQHAHGGAVDVNPLVNPWVRGERIDPPEGAEFADREAEGLGLIRAGDAVTEAFAAAGWGWGGDWVESKDYQHFSWNGR